MENLSSIVFHTVLLKMLSKMAKIKICDFVSANTKLEYLSSIVFHTAIRQKHNQLGIFKKAYVMAKKLLLYYLKECTDVFFF